MQGYTKLHRSENNSTKIVRIEEDGTTTLYFDQITSHENSLDVTTISISLSPFFSL